MKLFVPVVASLLLLCGAIPWLRWATGNPETTRLDKALVITHGGTYSGSWQSDDPATPVISIQTAEPVVIDGCTLHGRGTLIETGIEHVHVIVRNTRGFGLNPDVRGKTPGRFFSAESFDSIVIENNDLDATAGIYLLTYAGDFAPEHTIKILRNRVSNIDGRPSDGAGGFLNEAVEVQFAQLDKIQHLGGVEIAWNHVINEPGKSAVEDVINIYKSSGTSKSPIRIHDNYIQGAYPPDPMSAQYSGGGIMVCDGASTTLDGACGFVEAYDNQVIDTTNYGIAISAGHDSSFHNNRILSAGVLPDGRCIPAQNTGAYIWDAHHDATQSPPTFFNDGGHDNLIGWVKGLGRNDWWRPDASQWKNNISWPGRISREAELNEHALWVEKLKQHGIRVGAQ